MFNPLKMAGDIKGMEKMLKPALEKFMNDSGFVKKAQIEKLERRIEKLEAKLRDQLIVFIIKQSFDIIFACQLAMLNFNNMTWLFSFIDKLVPLTLLYMKYFLGI